MIFKYNILQFLNESLEIILPFEEWEDFYAFFSEEKKGIFEYIIEEIEDAPIVYNEKELKIHILKRLNNFIGRSGGVLLERRIAQRAADFMDLIIEDLEELEDM